MSKKVGILTLQFANNYGGFLQVFALSQMLEKLGFTPVIIDRVPTKHLSLSKRIKIFLTSSIHSYLNTSFSDFKKKYIHNRTQVIRTHDEILKYKDEFFAVIVGSDQVWRLAYTKEEGLGFNMFLDFVGEKTLKVSYAASFGTDQFEGSDADVTRVKELLKTFSAVSVREDSAVDICSTVFNIEAQHVLDPTLLLKGSDYVKLFKLPEQLADSPFLAYYLLDFDSNKIGFINTLSKTLQLEKVNIYRESEKVFNLSSDFIPTSKFRYPSFYHWLSSIYNSQFVVADSFHGVVFSIIFNKQFICIANRKRGVARMESLLRKFGLLDRLLFEGEEFNGKEIDYQAVNAILESERYKSMKFLQEALLFRLDD
ncbi:polysaccharide pyruvyl transferase family protein [Flectobacillus major]|uniref:polysaccharide pyruvyl transferase family protein n=1 Tax=Flectobacillus major TaxID=103 RepID=UPI000423F3AE|nr:polysaccharide pyruvyl transferase family protein [Flectobacillus major]